MIKCDVCGAERASITWDKEHLPVQLAQDVQVSLTVTVPVISCEACGERFTDDQAEDIRDETVKALRISYEAGILQGLATNEQTADILRTC